MEETAAGSNTFVRLREIMDDLTSAEKKAAEYISQNIDDVIRLSITELAQKSDSSESTIVRLCKKLKLKGYQELRVLLAQEAVSPVKKIHEKVILTDTEEETMRKVFQAAVQALNDTESVLSSEQLIKAVTYISQAESISFFGIGASGVIAQDAYYRFSKLGTSCCAATDGHSQLNKAILLGEQDVVVGISHSGRTRDVIMALDVAKKQGARTIAITQFGQSPIMDVADVVLFTSSRETAFRTEAMASRIAQTAILDSIFVSVSLTRYEKVIQNYDRAREMSGVMRINHIRDLHK
ncbi:MurR/RpiR family transcriptional regulator [Paenibacillus thalictri]|uniref:MurR/RpiR family transcriptional regulator n=1 Tax=Paenibacillus thalictri TaxID=2527873 RepID=A0A4Q9DL18_9BACL|nr:MurR/RpiR family transcriptional regulator [Paenibacillus thalictri]TBL75626.1 MurR/RpiR family transcriptional regulator [Paenibacillus thalictri]